MRLGGRTRPYDCALLRNSKYAPGSRCHSLLAPASKGKRFLVNSLMGVSSGATSLANAASCKSIENIDGNLRCVIDKKRGNNNVGVDWYDVISITSDVTKNNVETKVWRIDRPNVWQETTPYPNIKFRPGDRVSFNAGSSTQTRA